MTKEEAIKLLQATRMMLLGKDNQPISDLYDALEMAISALEQDPRITLDDFKRFATENNYALLTTELYSKAITALEQQPSRKGRWIDREEYDADRWKCSECGRTEQYQENFCPNCGARMEGSEE